MNTDFFAINSHNLRWYKKILTFSLIFLLLGITILVLATTLAATDVLSLTDLQYWPVALSLNIAMGLLCGIWGGNAHARKQIHSMIPTFVFLATLFYYIANVLIGLIFTGLSLVAFSLTAIWTIVCDDRSSR